MDRACRSSAEGSGSDARPPARAQGDVDRHHREPRADSAIGATTTGNSLKKVPTAVEAPLSR